MRTWKKRADIALLYNWSTRPPARSWPSCGNWRRKLAQRGASNYWAKLKERLKSEGASELLTNCQQLKLKAADGKCRLTVKATTFDAGVCGGKYLL